MTERHRYRSFVTDSARWDGFAFRDGDIVITTPAKCGTTWMQMICALLIFRTADLPAPLARLSPWLDMLTRPRDEVVGDLEAQTHRRFIKTHTPLDGLPSERRVTYIGVARDPRDVALSWDNHMANMDMGRFMGIRIAAVGADDLAELGITGPPPEPSADPVERFWAWVEAEGPAAELGGLRGLVHHVSTLWERRDDPNVHLFHYGDLRADLPGQMRRVADCLNVPPPTDELVAAATFSSMKQHADTLAPNSDTPFWKSNARFFDQARSGGWQELLDDAGRCRFDEALGRLASPELASFLLHGWMGRQLSPA